MLKWLTALLPRRSSSDFPLLVTSDRVQIGLRVVFDVRGQPLIDDHRCAVVANGRPLTPRCSQDASRARSLCSALERYLMQSVRRALGRTSGPGDEGDIYHSLRAQDGRWQLPLTRVAGTRDSPIPWSFTRKGEPDQSYRCEIDLAKAVIQFRVS